MPKHYQLRSSVGRFRAPVSIDDRIRLTIVCASDVHHLCAKCKKKFVPRRAGTGREVLAISVNRDGVFRHGGYLCPKCHEDYLGNKSIEQVTLDINVPRERKKGLNK